MTEMTSTKLVPSLFAVLASVAIVSIGSAPAPLEASADPFRPPDGQGEATEPTARESVPLLRQLLASESEYDGIEAAHKLLQVAGKDSEEVFNEFIGKLSSTYVSKRRNAAISLGRLCRAADLRIEATSVYGQSLKALGVALVGKTPDRTRLVRPVCFLTPRAQSRWR
jgi:hypothetical protein